MRKPLCAGIMLLIWMFALSQAAQAAFLNINFTLNDNGKVNENQGYYVILFNGYAAPIEASNPDTFTDFIRYDGVSYLWFHRRDNIPPPGYVWILSGTVNQNGFVQPDARGFNLTFNTADPSCFVSQYFTQQFSVHCATTDRYHNATLGRILDTLGQGPDIITNTMQTLYFNLASGLLPPLPFAYPSDPLEDYSVKPDLPKDYPYLDFDIKSFSIVLQ